MESEARFKTKTGYCHLLEDKIVLTRNGIIGDLAKVTVGRNILLPLFTYGILGVFLIYKSIDAIMKDAWSIGLLYGLAGIFFLFNIFKSAAYSATPIILKEQISKIEFRPAKKYLTRGYFKVDFTDNKGRLKHRLIMLPSHNNEAEDASEQAIRMLENSGLTVTKIG